MAFDLMKTLGLRPKGGSFSTYEDPYIKQLRELVYPVAQSGFPQLRTEAEQSWKRNILPTIQGEYQARRGMGIGSTPEVEALGRSWGDIESGISQQNLNARLNALQMLGGLQGQTVYEPAATPFGQQALQFLSPLLSTYMQGQNMKNIFSTKSTTPTTGGSGANMFQDLYKQLSIQPKSPAETYNENQQPDWMQYAGLAAQLLPMLFAL